MRAPYRPVQRYRAACKTLQVSMRVQDRTLALHGICAHGPRAASGDVDARHGDALGPVVLVVLVALVRAGDLPLARPLLAGALLAGALGESMRS